MIPGSIVGLAIWALSIYQWIIVARAITSWIPNISRYHPLVRLLVNITDPVLYPFQRLIPPEKTGFLDLSPVLAFFAIEFLEALLGRLAAPGL